MSKTMEQTFARKPRLVAKKQRPRPSTSEIEGAIPTNNPPKRAQIVRIQPKNGLDPVPG